MARSTGESSLIAQSIWQRLLARLRAIADWFRAGPLQLTGGSSISDVFGVEADQLPAELQEILIQLVESKGVVVDTLRQAIGDCFDLRRVVMGPGASVDAADDMTMLAEADEVLREIIVGAPKVQVLVEVASTRSRDRPARESAGHAILVLRDKARTLRALSSALLCWAESHSEQDREHLEGCRRSLVQS